MNHFEELNIKNIMKKKQHGCDLKQKIKEI